MMYNRDQKVAFIEQYTQKISTKRKVEQIFLWFTPYEESWGMDLSQQNVETMQALINYLTGVRSKSTETVLFILKEYVKWCKKSGYETSDAVFQVRNTDNDKIRKQMVSSPKDLKTRLDECFGKAEFETVDLTYKVFLWLAFLGLSDREAIEVTSDCVDFEKMVLRYDGVDYELYRECVEDFRKVCELTSFWYHHPKYTLRRDRAEGNIILRGFRTPTVSLDVLRPMVTRKIAEYSAQKEENDSVAKLSKEQLKEMGISRRYTYMSYNKIHLSGVFYRMFEDERCGVPVNFSEYVGKYMDDRLKQGKKDYSYSDTRTCTTVANRLEKELQTDYERWKCTF